ncbi:MAG: hypothetical protein RSO15_15445 [Bacteroides sp.]|uniref:hypothetical protein n=1 Tax=Bacteroides sp. TaxID=29523 RepID=UPI002FC7E55B
MNGIDDYFLDEKGFRENIAKGIESKTKEKNDTDSASKIEVEQESSPKVTTHLKKEKQLEILKEYSSFDSIFKVNSDIQFSHLIRISPTMAIRLQRILLAKQLQGQKMPLNSLIENILNRFVMEYEKEIKTLEKPLFSK